MAPAWLVLLVLLTFSLVPPTNAASLSSGGGQTLKPAPTGFTAPPERLAPTPPGAPMLPDRDVGVINSADDVCKVCTRRSYSDQCFSDYNLDCMSAIKQYFTNVLGVKETYCDCYTAVYNQLRVMCPNVDKMLKYSFTCDRYCYYGTKCPVTPVLYAVLKSGYVDLANRVTAGIVGFRSTASSTGQAAMVVELRPSKAPSASKLCYTLQADRFLPRPLTTATLRFGFIGQSGPAVQTLFRKNADNTWAQRTACLPSAAATLRSIAGNPGRFHVAIDTPQGGLRGQLLPSISLIAQTTAKGAGVPCSQGKRSTTCKAFVGLSLTASSISYTIDYVPNPLQKVQAANIVRVVQRKAGPTTGWPPLVSFFGTGLSTPSVANTVSKDLNTILVLMSGAYLVNITSGDYPRGALLGRIQDSLTVQTTLTGDQVLSCTVRWCTVLYCTAVH